MAHLSVKNWEHFQHYKDRSPPWIKLHRDLLRDYQFSCLQDASKLHLMLIWLLASQLDNRIPNDAAWIQRQIGVSEDVNLKPLIEIGFLVLVQDASKALAGCKRVAMPEAETEAYKEEKERAEAQKKTEPPKASRKRAASTQGKRLPEDWEPSSELLTWAMNERKDLDMQRVIDGFTDHWRAATGKNATKRDWDATFRNWVRNERSHNRKGTGGTNRETVSQRIQRQAEEARRRAVSGSTG